MAAVRYGAEGRRFEFNWDGAWLSDFADVDAKNFERVATWAIQGGGWVALRRLVVNPLSDDEVVFKGKARVFDTFAEVLANWPELGAVEVTS